MLYNNPSCCPEVPMNRLAPLLLLLMLLTLAALVLLSRTSCPLCGRPVYLFFVRFCSCR